MNHGLNSHRGNMRLLRALETHHFSAAQFTPFQRQRTIGDNLAVRGELRKTAESGSLRGSLNGPAGVLAPALTSSG
jgi:hypothetical protein